MKERSKAKKDKETRKHEKKALESARIKTRWDSDDEASVGSNLCSLSSFTSLCSQLHFNLIIIIKTITQSLLLQEDVCTRSTDRKEDLRTSDVERSNDESDLIALIESKIGRLQLRTVQDNSQKLVTN